MEKSVCFYDKTFSSTMNLKRKMLKVNCMKSKRLESKYAKK